MKIERIEKLTRKWWFFAGLIALQFVVMPFSTKNFGFENIEDMVGWTLSHAIQLQMRSYYLYFQVLALVVLFALFLFKNRMKKVFSLYAALSYVAFALLQNVAVTEEYGLSVVSVNVLMFLMVAYVWFLESKLPENDYSFDNLNWKTAWMIPLALLAFWLPINQYLRFDFSLSRFLFSGSSLTFCMMTPVFLTIMTLNLPKVNLVTYRVTAIIGVIIGCYNMMMFQNPQRINLALIHLPLMLISVYAVIVGYRMRR